LALSRIDSQPALMVVRAFSGYVQVGLQLGESLQSEQVPPVSLHFSHATSQTFCFIPLYVAATAASPPLIQKSSSQASASSPQAFSAHIVCAAATVAPFSSQWHFLSSVGSSQDANSHLFSIFVHFPAFPLAGLYPSAQVPRHISVIFSNADSVKKDAAAETG